jgi:hypothetical protein
MVITPNSIHSENSRLIVPGSDLNSAQSLRTTFAGWGPRL